MYVYISKSSYLEFILSVISGVVPDVLETMPKIDFRVFTPTICTRVCMGVCKTKTEERTHEPTSREVLQPEQRSDSMSFASLPLLVLLKKIQRKQFNA